MPIQSRPIPEAVPTIAIIGGGAAGSLTALQLARLGANARIVLIEPAPVCGLGLAYSTPSRAHLLNVPAGKISALPDHPGHFLRWLRANGDASATPDTFASRAVFGQYLSRLLAATSGIETVQGTVRQLRRSRRGYRLTLEDGRTLAADRVVLAVGNLPPQPLRNVDPACLATGSYCHNVWHETAYAGLDANAAVALVGSGLTAIDTLLRLRELGHRGVVTMVSRHGVLPSAHTSAATAPAPAPRPAIPVTTPPTCLAYLRVFRQALAGGLEWRAAVDSLRPVTNLLWRTLPPHEQQRFRRRLQRRWDVVRHRMAPAVAAHIEAELAAGTLQVQAGAAVAVRSIQGGAELRYLHLGTQTTLSVQRVMNCTGPSPRYQDGGPLLRQLFADGLATAGPRGAGLATDADGALLNREGAASRDLFTLGPARQGSLLESIAIPEIRSQAAELAARLAASLPVLLPSEELAVPA